MTPLLNNQAINSPVFLPEVDIKPKIDELMQATQQKQHQSEKPAPKQIVNEQKPITAVTTVSSPPPTSPPAAETVKTIEAHHQRSSSFDIYRDKKSLPPTKRFKNYSYLDSSSTSASESTTSMLLSQSRTSVDDPQRSLSSQPNPDDEDRLVIDVDKNESSSSSSATKTADNKLLDLAKIALERETN